MEIAIIILINRNSLFDELYPGAWDQLKGSIIILGSSEVNPASSSTTTSTPSSPVATSAEVKLIKIDEDSVSIDRFSSGCLNGICDDLVFQVDLELAGSNEILGVGLQEDRKYGNVVRYDNYGNFAGVVYNGNKINNNLRDKLIIQLPSGKSTFFIHIQPIEKYTETDSSSGTPVGTPLNFPGGNLRIYFHGDVQDIVIPPESMYPSK